MYQVNQNTFSWKSIEVSLMRRILFLSESFFYYIFIEQFILVYFIKENQNYNLLGMQM